MKPRDAILSVLRHEEVRPVPYSLGFEGDVAEQLDSHYGNQEWRETIRTYMAGTGVVSTLKREPVKGREGYFVDLFGSVEDAGRVDEAAVDRGGMGQ